MAFVTVFADDPRSSSGWKSYRVSEQVVGEIRNSDGKGFIATEDDKKRTVLLPMSRVFKIVYDD